MSGGDGLVNVCVDRYVEAEDGSVQSVVTFALGMVVENPEDALRFCAVMVMQAFEESPTPNRAERRWHRPH